MTLKEHVYHIKKFGLYHIDDRQVWNVLNQGNVVLVSVSIMSSKLLGKETRKADLLEKD